MASTRSSSCDGGAILMAGISSTSAPSSVSLCESSPACSRDRVTTMCWPKSGRFSNQFNFFRNFTTSPITVSTAGEHGETGAVLAMRERNARVIRPGHHRRNAGHDLEGNFRRRKFLRFLATAPEDVGIAALEPHDAFAFTSLGNHQRGQLLL